MEEQLLESKKQKVVKHAIFLPVCVAFILWVLWLFVLARDENEILKGYYQVEITGVEAASGFFLPGGGGDLPAVQHHSARHQPPQEGAGVLGVVECRRLVRRHTPRLGDLPGNLFGEDGGDGGHGDHIN